MSERDKDLAHRFVAPLAAFWRGRGETVLRIGLVAMLLAAMSFFLYWVDKSYPIRHWLFWIYARAWLGALFFAVACLSAGSAVLSLVVKRTLPLFEHFALAIGLGVFVFFVEVFLAGVLGLLGWGFFFAGPALLIAWGGPAAFRLTRRVSRHFRAVRAASQWPRPPLVQTIVLVAGLVGLAALYLPILTPDNVAYDARWYHLPLAEHYVAEGAIRRLPEGWLPGAYPHLVSHLYTWAMLAPQASYFDKVELCAHIEFVIFLATMPGLVALTRHLVPRARMPLAWVALFLFPEIFAYDSLPSTGADHVAAMWAPLILITFFRAAKGLNPRFAGLMAVMMAGALCTKFTAATVVLFPALATTALCVFRLVLPRPGERRSVAARVLAAAAVAGLLATAPHWLKNLFWYGDPLYPTLHRVFGGEPWTPDFRVPFEHWFYPPDYHPTRDLKGVLATLKALFTYSFVPNDWWVFHRDVPIFGSLATFSLGMLPFLRGTRRLWVTQLALHSGLFLWYSVHHFDRYLQTLLPWMAASLAATLYLAWQKGKLVRAALVALVGAQVVWGADVYFFPTHQMAGGSAVKRVLDLIGSGHQQKYKDRLTDSFQPYVNVAKGLAPDAKILVHENHVHWAFERASVSDWQGTQAGISYGRLRGIKDAHTLLDRMGVTHVYWDTESSKGYDTLAADLVFFSFAKFALPRGRTVGHQTIAPMPKRPPKEDFKNRSVLFMGCTNTYANGTYDLKQLVISDFDPRRRYPDPKRALVREPTPDIIDVELEAAALTVVDPGCYPKLDATVKKAGFSRIAKRGRLDLYARPLRER